MRLHPIQASGLLYTILSNNIITYTLYFIHEVDEPFLARFARRALQTFRACDRNFDCVIQTQCIFKGMRRKGNEIAKNHTAQTLNN